MHTERIIGGLCAPALAGIKPSNLISLKKNVGDVKAQVRLLHSQLSRRGIHLRILRETEEKLLILVYRPDKLLAYLVRDEIKAFLVSMGYPEDGNLETYLDILSSRLQQEDFPHEIGAFLGYPIEDIRGFIHNSREGILLVGEWKVYSDAEKARRTFERYRSCRQGVVRRLMAGSSLAQIFCAA